MRVAFTAALIPIIGMAAALAWVAPAGAMEIQPSGSLLGMPPYAVAVQGNYAYCLAHSLESFRIPSGDFNRSVLEVYDISDQTRPEVVGVLAFDVVMQDIATSGAYAYVTDGATLRTLDVSSPLQPTEVSSLSVAGSAPDLCVSGGCLYRSSSLDGLRIYDLTDPAHPAEVGSYPGSVGHVTVAGQYAYLSAGYALVIVDVSDPSQPVKVGETEIIRDYWTSVSVEGSVAIMGDYAVLANDYLYLVDVSDRTSPTQLLQYEVIDGWWPAWVRDVVSDGGYAYARGRGNKLAVLDWRSPLAPWLVGFVAEPDNIKGMELSAGRLYLADYAGGVRVLNISEPSAPQDLTRGGAPAFCHQLSVSGGYAYGASWWPHKMLAMEVTDPDSPEVVGAVQGGGDQDLGNVIVTQGDYAYLGSVGAEAGLCIYDVSDPAAPRYVGWPVLGSIYAAAAREGYLYVSHGIAFSVLDISQPEDAYVQGTTTAGEGATDMALMEGGAGLYALVTTTVYGLRVVDVSDARHPAEVGWAETSHYASAVATSGRYAYVGDPTGLRIFDLSVPASPQQVGFWSVPDLDVADLAVVGSYLYVSDNAFGLRMLGLTRPLDPVEVANCPLPESAYEIGVMDPLGPAGLAIAGSHVYLADYDWGIYVFDLVSTFSDVPADYWAADGVERCAAAGLVSGYGDDTYRPAENVDRGGMAVYISRALAGGDANVPEGPGVATFPDVPVDHWAFKYVEYATAAHVVQGYDNGTYRPDQAVDRGQIAVFMARALAGSDAAVPEGPETPTFPDVTSSNDWSWCYRHVEYIASLYVAGGYDDAKYHPERVVTRDQMAVFVTRAFDMPI